MEEDKSVTGLIKYISSRKPEFIEQMRGADEALIDHYQETAQELAGFPFPADYLEFLKLMGGKTPIDFGYDASMEASEVLKTYKMRLADLEELPATCHLIAVGGYQIEQIALRCSVAEDGTVESGPAYSAAGENLRYAMADSFLGLLFRRAFEICGAAHLPVTATYIGTIKEPSLNTIATLGENFGWHKYWFSDSVSLSLSDKESNLILYAEQHLGGYNWLKIAGKNRNQVALIGEQIARLAKMEFEKWWN